MVMGNVLYLANLGDSAAVIYQFMPNTKTIFQCVTLSNSHRPKLEEDRILSAGGWVGPDGYILGVLGCSRSMGDRELKYYEDYVKSGLKQEPNPYGSIPKKRNNNRKGKKQQEVSSTMKWMVSPVPEIDVFNLDETDALLVIGSDGLWDYMPPKRCVELVNESWIKRNNVDDVCEALVHAAKKAKSPDDITAMVISLIDRD